MSEQAKVKPFEVVMVGKAGPPRRVLWRGPQPQAKVKVWPLQVVVECVGLPVRRTLWRGPDAPPLSGPVLAFAEELAADWNAGGRRREEAERRAREFPGEAWRGENVR